MKVTFQISPTQEYVLAHGGARGVGLHLGPVGWRHSLASIVESKARVGAAYTKPKTRKNRTRTLGFSVTVEHASLQEAELFRLDYPDQIEDAVGDLFVESQDENGHKLLRKYPGVAIRNVSLVESIGVTTVVSYDILAGEVQNVGAT